MPREHIDRAADRHGVPRHVLRSMARVESTNDTRAVSKKGARGEFQVMPATAREMGYSPEDMHDPEKGAEAGARYVRKMYDRFGDWDSAIEAYNAGPARVAYRKKKGIPLPAETREHLAKIKATQAAEALRKAAR
jgi:soluble lytic murein transglycosylase-like protein